MNVHQERVAGRTSLAEPQPGPAAEFGATDAALAVAEQPVPRQQVNVDRTLAPEKFVYLRDQEPLTDAELAAAERALAYVQDACDYRKQRIRQLGLDPSLWLPAAEWDPHQGFYRNYRALYDRSDLKLLRLFCKHLTRYSLGWLDDTPGANDPLPGEPAEEIDRRLATLQATADPRIRSYALYARAVPPPVRISPPRKFGEVGWIWQRKLVNHDTVAYLERILVLYQAGLLDEDAPNSLVNLKRPRILEIGAGYGGLAYYVKQFLPNCHYTIVDLPESLAFSAAYLGALYQGQSQQLGLAAASAASEPGFSYLPNFEFPGLLESGAQFDLVINTLSFSEMARQQVRAYCEGISQMVGERGVFYEQNHDNRHLGLVNAQDIVRKYFRHRVRLSVSPRNETIQRNERGPLVRAHYDISKLVARSLGRKYPSVPILEHGYANLWSHRPLTAAALTIAG